MGTERRWGARKPLNLEVVIDNQPLCLLRGQIGNISIGGLYVKTSGELPANSRVELVLLLQEQGGTRVYRMPAMVVRAAGDGAGLMFDQYDVNAFRTLVALLLDTQRRAAALAPLSGTADTADQSGEPPSSGASAESAAASPFPSLPESDLTRHHPQSN